jgi:hypothetical protein
VQHQYQHAWAVQQAPILLLLGPTPLQCASTVQLANILQLEPQHALAVQLVHILLWLGQHQSLHA